MKGVFQTSREIFENPIWQDVVKFRIFFFIVGNAVFAEEGVTISGIRVKRGQFLRSYRNLIRDLEYTENRSIKKYSLSVISKKIDQLVKEERLKIEDTELGTLFTVVNYAEYQGFERYKRDTENGERTEKEQGENGERTGKERRKNNNKNVKNEEELKDLYSLDSPDDVKEIFTHWQSKGIKKHRELTQKMRSAINARLQNYTVDELKDAITNYHTVISSDLYFFSYKWTLEDFMKPDNVVNFISENDPFNNYRKASKEKPSRGPVQMNEEEVPEERSARLERAAELQRQLNAKRTAPP